MANTTIRLRKSGVASNVPVSLELGELALNYADGKLYYKNDSGVITYISSGATTNSFATINANSSLVISTSNTDILSFAGANNITVTGDGITKTVTIGAKLSDSLTLTEPQIGASANAVANVYSFALGVQSIASNADLEAQNARSLANSAYNQANGATTLAQSAYDYANTLTGGGSTTFFNYLTVQKQLYTANASQTNFFVNYTPPYVTVVINGATIDSSEYSTSTANTVVLNNAASAGDIVDITGFYQANSATISGGSGTDQWVRDTANSAVANTITTQGVDAWQNTQITAVNGLAAGAYNKANNALPLAGGTITGSIIVGQNLTVSGNLYIAGNTTSIGTQDLVLDDSLIYLANNNPANIIDIGLVGNFTTDHYQHTGIVRNHLTNNWVFFSNVSSEPTTTVNFAEANIVYDSITTGGVITPTITINGKDWQSVEDTQNTNIIAVNQYAQSAYATANVLIGVNTTQNTNITAVNQFAQSSYNTANGANGMAVGAYNKANNALANTTGTFAGDLSTTGNIVIQSSQSSTSTGTGALKVLGGVGVTGNVYADKIFVNGLFWAANGNVISTGGGTSGSVNQFNVYKYVATLGQTIFTGPDSSSASLNYTAGAIIVVLNGLTLKPGTDYTATDGSSITLTVAADLSDELNIYAFTSTTVNTANTLSVFSYVATTGQTSFGGLDLNSNRLGYLPGNLFTTYNGITLRNGVDYTAANGSYINLNFSAAANDEIVVYTFGTFNVANTYTISQADAKFTTAGKSLAINFFRS